LPAKGTLASFIRLIAVPAWNWTVLSAMFARFGQQLLEFILLLRGELLADAILNALKFIAN
jgi:hypothetical protein